MKNICTIVPPGCPAETCGCQPGVTTCGSDNTLTVCNPDGMSTTQTTCTLGCKSTGAACETLAPSNGLGSALAGASNGPAVTLGSGSVVDTDSGAITTTTGTLSLSSSLVVQTGVQPIRVFAAHSFVIGDVHVIGSNAIAFVADGTIEIDGTLDLVPALGVAGPGAQSSTSPATGQSQFTAACLTGSAMGCGYASGGGGNDTNGAPAGGQQAHDNNGGAAVTGFSPLVGGGAGGFVPDSGTPPNPLLGGGGGGACQLVSATAVNMHGVINIGGGGGRPSAGGGAGGVVVIEAPVVTVDDNAGIAANGGGGGGCDTQGGSGSPDDVPAPAGTCAGSDAALLGLGGAGATMATAAVSGFVTAIGEVKRARMRKSIEVDSIG